MREAIAERLGEGPGRLDTGRSILLAGKQLLPCGLPGGLRLAPQPTLEVLDQAHGVVQAGRRALQRLGALLVLDGPVRYICAAREKS